MSIGQNQVLLLLTIVIAIAIGWYLGRYQYRTRSKGLAIKPSGSAHRHRSNLRLLFDSYSDAAIDELLADLDVSVKTLPIHLSIGRHFRQEGEVDRAILIHQNLLAHPQLSSSSSNAVIYELARDYKAAGLYDRAEALLAELVHSREFSDQARRLLLSILERQRDWEEASSLISKWDCKREPDLAKRMAHYHCEIATQALASRAFVDAKKSLTMAKRVDSNNPRVRLLSAKLHVAEGNIRRAIKALREVLNDTPRFSSEALPLLSKYSKESDSEELMLRFLSELYARTSSEQVLIELSAALVKNLRKAEAQDLLEAHLEREQSSALLKVYVKMFFDKDVLVDSKVAIMKSAVLASETQENAYMCAECGYQGSFHWQCPSCAHWESTTSVIQ